MENISLTKTNRFSFASVANLELIEHLYSSFKKDPASVEKSWHDFFVGYEMGLAELKRKKSQKSPVPTVSFEGARVESLIAAYRHFGHLGAQINPLINEKKNPAELDLAQFNLQDISASKTFLPANLPGNKPMSVTEIQDFLKETYCGSIGVEIQDVEGYESFVWLRETMEACRNKPVFPVPLKKRIHKKLSEAEVLEKFLQARYLGQKRFSVEGLDVLIPMIDILLNEAKRHGVEEVSFGMAHRGRINVLVNILGKTVEKLLSEFEDTVYTTGSIEGDVKYHMGYSNYVDTFDQGKIRCYLSPNPSHLEMVGPVLQGFSYSRQHLLNDEKHKKVLPLVFHGDAAFIGQGVTAETLNMAGICGYITGGTIHVVTNNQIGFTTNPQESRSSDYCSAIAKTIGAPIFHVNADHVEACIWTAILAVTYRQKFGKDVVIDLIGYRRHGHNETDEPGFTQPLMYQKISQHASSLEIYTKQLEQEGVFSGDEGTQVNISYRQILQGAYEKLHGKDFQPKPHIPPTEYLPSLSYTAASYSELMAPVKTSVSLGKLTELNNIITKVPPNFSIHPKLERLLKTRTEMLSGEGQVDWAVAELLAFASLMDEGHPVRLSGQDCGRGTFSHRHALITDYHTNKSYNVFSPLFKGQVKAEILNSPLSELGVLGFEFGYSVANPEALTIWEAQFGDFANGAQIMIDQFIVACEAKWKQNSGLVLLLPHGYEGQGPEHSSARLERFLQLCGNYNIIVAMPTTPANYFHLLRRQLSRKFRKPLIIMTPKSLLRRPDVTSAHTLFTESNLAEVIGDDSSLDPKTVTKGILCSGKVYYDLKDHLKEIGNKNTPIIRLEQLYPFADEQLKVELNKYPQLKELRWVQEEPQNMGAWTFVRPYLEGLPAKYKIVYIGRKYSGTTAEGSYKAHQFEQKRIVTEALK